MAKTPKNPEEKPDGAMFHGSIEALRAEMQRKFDTDEATPTSMLEGLMFVLGPEKFSEAMKNLNSKFVTVLLVECIKVIKQQEEVNNPVILSMLPDNILTVIMEPFVAEGGRRGQAMQREMRERYGEDFANAVDKAANLFAEVKARGDNKDETSFHQPMVKGERGV